jgi:hypothetical protein
LLHSNKSLPLSLTCSRHRAPACSLSPRNEPCRLVGFL